MSEYILECNENIDRKASSQGFAQGIRSMTKAMNDLLEAETFGSPKVHRKLEKLKYPSGCIYDGESIYGSWVGEGEYTFPHKVKYTGTFSDSEFHGDGTLKYPMGQTLHGKWVKGKLVSWTYIFGDGLEYSDKNYCLFPNRAFYSTIKSGTFQPPDEERLCNITPPREIPPGCYDCGEGFYNPKLSCIVSTNEANKILRIPTLEEALWIEKNCRSAEIKPTGYRPDLYEYWSSGSAASVKEIIQIETQKQEDAIDSEDDYEED